MAIAGSPGWSESGGPWVLPSEGMKEICLERDSCRRRKTFKGKLAHPRATWSIPKLGVREAFGPPGKGFQSFYADSAVVAYRIPTAVASEEKPAAKITASGEGLDPAVLKRWKSRGDHACADSADRVVGLDPV